MSLPVRIDRILFALLPLLLVPVLPAAWAAAPPAVTISPDQVLLATQEPVGPRVVGAAALRAQILLDRARFSPGEIDGSYGSSLRVAVSGFQKSHSLPVTGVIDSATWAELDQDPTPTLARYRITDADVAGPYLPLPADMMEKSTLPALGYTSSLEELGERFHSRPALLQALNPDKDLAKPGEEIFVPNVIGLPPIKGAHSVVVDKSSSTVALLDADGKLLAQFPASTGSAHDPLPLGRWKVNGVARQPVFKYNPGLFWDADSDHSKATLQPGPNNPVGVVWVDLSKSHYGIHGTPEPSKIGKTQSHGCIRLTNWDATALSDAVRPGMAAVLQK